MIGAVARKLFGSSNDRRIRAYRPRVEAINALEGAVSYTHLDVYKRQRGRLRPHSADRRLGASRSVRAGSRLEGCRPAGDEHGGKRLSN